MIIVLSRTKHSLQTWQHISNNRTSLVTNHYQLTLHTSHQELYADKSMFWHGIWKDCGKMPSGVVYNIMKKTRSTYHYMLRALKKKKHYKSKILLSKSMLRSNYGTYWKSARVLRKNNFNRTNVVDDVNGDIQIANLFKDKYERLFNSMQCSKEESELMKTQIDSEVANVCNTTKTCRL